MLILAGCSKPYNPDALLGSWKMRDIAPFPGEDIDEATTFFKNDSVISEAFIDGKRVQHSYGTYKLDREGRKLSVSMKTEDGYGTFESEIIKLTDEELILVRQGEEVVLVRP